MADRVSRGPRIMRHGGKVTVEEQAEDLFVILAESRNYVCATWQEGDIPFHEREKEKKAYEARLRREAIRNAGKKP